jgi:hypothetical protein
MTNPRHERLHNKRVDPGPFLALWRHDKRAEIRKLDDWSPAVGDTLVLEEFDRDTKTYSGYCVRAEITHILRAEDGDYGLEPGFAMLSLRFKKNFQIRKEARGEA